MSGAGFERIKQVVLEARALEGAARRSYLDGLADPDLRREAESLLARDGAPARIVETGALASGLGARLAEALKPLRGPPIPEQIGPYAILGVLGEGGMGTVYRAEQSTPRRRVVALKVLRPGRVSERAVARFEAEREALAMMSHPGIARMYDAGAESDGRLYFAMELVRGRPITEHADHRRLTTHERLVVFVQACDAVQYAHRKGIIHRDLKPSNILVSEKGRPLVKVIDFGIAMVVEEPTGGERLTRESPLVGTPEYMSPEQTGAFDARVDARTDVYALGVVLHELLTGERPQVLSGLTPSETLRAIRESETPRPSERFRPTPSARGARPVAATKESASTKPEWRTLDSISRTRGATPAILRRQLEGDLDAIVLTALRKDPARRYPTAESVAADIRRYLAGEPVLAREEGLAATDVVVPGNLQQSLSSFIGRERQIGEIRDLVMQYRLVTLTGVGGGGKTRLVLEAARRMMGEFADGVWLIEFAPLRDSALVPQAVLSALGLKRERGRPALDTLVEHLRNRRMLLLLDNCEHLLRACGELAAGLLRAAGDLRVIATSREMLRVEGERVYAVPPLEGPPLDGAISHAALRASESALLFEARAAQVSPGFTLEDVGAEVVARICRRLDGLPLAIELAAARVNFLTVEEVAKRLDDRFTLLAAGSSDAAPHHQTLRGLVAWSYDLLTPDEQALCRRLSVFSSWTLLAAEGVCADDALPAPNILGAMSGLFDKSLIEADTVGAEPGSASRYRMLETIREFSQERLRESGEEPWARERFRDFFLAFAEQASPHIKGSDAGRWIRRLQTDEGNLRAAIEICHETSIGVAQGLRLAGSLGPYWESLARPGEGLETLKRLLARPEAAARTADRALALYSAAMLAVRHGDFAEAREFGEECLAIRRTLDDRRGMVTALGVLGDIAHLSGDFARARPLREEGLAIARKLNDAASVANVLGNLGILNHDEGNDARGDELLLESLSIHRQLGNKVAIGHLLGNLGITAYRRGDYVEARTFSEEGLALHRELHSLPHIAISLESLGDVARAQQRYAAARTHLREALGIWRGLGARAYVAGSLEAFGKLAVDEGQWIRAARLFGAAAALRDAVGAPLADWPARELQLNEERLERSAGADELGSARACGRQFTMDQAIADALSEAEAGVADPGSPTGHSPAIGA